MRPVIQSRTLATADPNGIAETQTPLAGGNLTLDGALVVAGVAILDAQRRVIITSAADDTARTFTVTGTDEQGRTITEAIAGVDTAAATSLLDFFTVTQIAVDAATAGAVIAGTNGVGASIPIPIDKYLSPTSIGLGIIVIGTINYTIEHTFDDVFDGNASAIRSWFDHPTLAGETASMDGNYMAPPSACRILTNSGGGSAVFTLIQAGAVA
jgi:hypothetical protein